MSRFLTKIPTAHILLAVVLLVVAVCGGAVTVYASKTNLATIATEKQQEDPTLVLILGMAEIVDVPGPVADIMVANPSTVDVMALQSNRLYLIGMALGTTNIIAVDENGDIIKRLTVHVKVDDATLQKTLRELFPNEDIQVRTMAQQLVLSGTVSTPDVAERVTALVGHYMGEVQGLSGAHDQIIVNMLKVRGEAQVMLRVKILEVSRTLLRERGSDTQIADIGDLLGDKVDVNPNAALLDGIFGGVVNTGLTEEPFAVFGLLESLGAFGPIDTILTLLEQNGLARILAEPNLTAISGEQAGFLAGGEFAVPSGRDSQGNISVTFRQFGVSLSFAPIVMSEDRINLSLSTEVSSLSGEATVLGVPSLDVRRASTTVEMGSGKTLMIAGLLQSQTIKRLVGIPGMVNTPIIGDLMSSEGFRRQETEMVVLVTPYLVKPYDNRQQAKKIERKNEKQLNLAKAFSQNIRRTYGRLNIEGLFEGEQSFGYIIE